MTENIRNFSFQILHITLTLHWFRARYNYCNLTQTHNLTLIKHFLLFYNLL